MNYFLSINLPPVPLAHYLILAGALFAMGIVGILVRRNLLVIFMSIELILNAANLAMLAFARFSGNMNGHIIVFFVIAVAAAEAAVGLSLLMVLYRYRDTINIDDVNILRW